MKAYSKDIIRTIKKEKKRFVAISVIVALGVAMTSGLRASCNDLRLSVDTLFDDANLYDLQIQSTLGLVDNDIKALKGIDHVDEVEGIYEETVHIKYKGKSHTATIKTLSTISSPVLMEGKLPTKTNEIVVSQYCAQDTNKALGDTISIIQDEENIKKETFKIVGIALDPTDINAKEGATSFRSSSSNEYSLYVLEDVIDSDIYTSIYITLSNSKEMNCFSEAYKTYVEETSLTISNQIKSSQQDKRTSEIKRLALDEISKQENKANKKLNDAKKKLDDASNKLTTAKAKLDDAKKTLEDSKKQLEDAQTTLDQNRVSTLATFDQYETEINNGYTTLNEKETELNNYKQTITDTLSKLALSYQAGYIDDSTYTTTLTELNTKLSTINAGLETISNSRSELDTKKATLLENKTSAIAKIDAAQVEIDENLVKYNDGLKEYEDGIKEYNEGLKEYQDGLKKYNKNKKKAEAKIQDAKDEVEDIDSALWYIQTRANLSSYNNVSSDAGAIESLGVVFSITFLIVAVLVCLTTINRMIDEDRGLIGCYQALGYYLTEIQRKYVVYALVATIIGALIGDVIGYLGLPYILKLIFTTMYQLPNFVYGFSYFYGIGAPIVFIVAILLSVIITCVKSLMLSPATLMRPKSPKKGSRVLLERTPLWAHFSFLNKVTIRNLFRYKKRLFMTLIGIALCNSLLVCGFGIKDSVENLRTRQYQDVTLYDAMYITASKNHDKLENLLEKTDHIGCYITSVTLKHNEHNETMQLYVLDETVDLSPYLGLTDITSKEKLTLDDGVIVTRNASIIEEFNALDTVSIQDLSCNQYNYKVTHIIENYLGNSIFMSKSIYDQTFGDYEENAYLINSDDNSLLKDISKQDIVLSSVIKQDLLDDFKQSFKLINLVVYIVIIFAALLAFAVLFTLSTTNISERERELATIKVLGFYDAEVHKYVNKETLILTIIGIILGIPFGYLFTNYLTLALKMPSLYFAVSIKSTSYIISCMISFAFAIVVNTITNKTLNQIDPVEALKSVE